VASGGSAAGRVTGAWSRLPGERRMAALASLGLFVAMFLPWYQITARTRNGLDSASVSAFGDFSFVEAAVLLVALGVLVLLFMRAEGRAFHLPGGDGSVILAAGAWTTVLLVWRAFDKPHTDQASALGLQWGFVFAFAASGALAYAGHRVRAAHRAEPPLPGEAPTAPLAGPPPAPAPTEPVTGPTERHEPSPTPAADTPPTVPEARPSRLRRRPPDPLSPDGLTHAHGSEEPLPRDDLTYEMTQEERRGDG
jgi:hypothetical protein